MSSLAVDVTVVTRTGKQQISPNATPFYHCNSRCVRRASLYWIDSHSGKSYEYRRQQIEDDLLRLASVFFIDVAAFAVMSNHYHLVLYIDQEECKSASAVERWHKLLVRFDISQRYVKGALRRLSPYSWYYMSLYIFFKDLTL